MSYELFMEPRTPLQICIEGSARRQEADEFRDWQNFVAEKIAAVYQIPKTFMMSEFSLVSSPADPGAINWKASYYQSNPCSEIALGPWRDCVLPVPGDEDEWADEFEWKV